jgi:DNA-binding MarR family transcriptional regulator
VTDVRWLDEDEETAWRRLQLMQLQLTATLSRELAESSGLSYQDYLVLVALTDQPDDRMRAFELGRVLGWEKSRLSHHISRMVERGFVDREKCETDKRGAFVVVTKRGRKAIEAAAPGHVAGVRRHFIDLLRPAQLRSISTIAGTVLEALIAECDDEPED